MEQIISHRHWVTIHLFGRELHICARCSGAILGFLTARILLTILHFLFTSISFLLGFSIAFIMATPSIIDWTTQTLGFRQSNTNLRFTTGFFEGVGIQLLSLVEIPNFTRLLIFVTIGLVVSCVGVFGRRIGQRYI